MFAARQLAATNLGARPLLRAPPAAKSASASYSSSSSSSASPKRMATKMNAMPAHLSNPAARDAHYGANTAQYLVDLHDTPGATFNFCGGMMFGLSLSDTLRSHLAEVAAAGAGDSRQPKVYGAETRRMAMCPDGYSKDAAADNVRVFHGREVRKVAPGTTGAVGGSNMVIHLSLAGATDPEGWSKEEVGEYSGWLSDQQRRWRNRELLESEGFNSFSTRFGPEAFTLHHRFYLHLDGVDGGRMWLAAEDGCEGFPAPRAPPARDFGMSAKNALSFFK